LLPLVQQVGLIEGLSVVVQEVPSTLPLTDQHLLSFLSELLKICSVGDGEMTEISMSAYAVDKNGFVNSSAGSNLAYPTHASALFKHRMFVLSVSGISIVVPEELPAGCQVSIPSLSQCWLGRLTFLLLAPSDKIFVVTSLTVEGSRHHTPSFCDTNTC